jgi:hypothetical protein
MVEISKNMKIMLLVDAIAGFIYGVFYLIIPELYSVIIDSPNFDAQFWRLWGATCIAFGIFCLMAIKRAEWEEIKILVELGILWLILTVVVNFITLATVRLSWTAYASQWFDNIIIIVLIVANCFFYMKESKTY